MDMALLLSKGDLFWGTGLTMRRMRSGKPVTEVMRWQRHVRKVGPLTTGVEPARPGEIGTWSPQPPARPTGPNQKPASGLRGHKIVDLVDPAPRTSAPAWVASTANVLEQVVSAT